jgi:DNA modification methylase
MTTNNEPSVRGQGSLSYIAEPLRPLALPIADLVLDAANARRHPEKNMEAIVASLTRFGQRLPIVVQKQGMIVRAGNGRVEAAKRMGWSHIAAVVVDESAVEATAFAIADNRSAELAEWDDETLASLLNTLPEDVLGSTGFSQDDLGELMNSLTPEVVEDEAPEPLPEPVSKTGDLWVMGEHRLLCGDSTKAEDVGRVMDGASADLCFTSPPYGNQRQYTEASTEHLSDWDALMRGVFAVLPMSDAGQVLVNLGLIHRNGEWLPYWDSWIAWMREQGWRRFGWYVWDQGFGLPGDWNGRLAPSHEFVFHFNKDAVHPSKWVNKKPENIKARNRGESTMRGADGKTKAFTNPEASAQTTKIPDSIIRVGRQVGSDGHPAQFPIEFPAFAVQTWPGTVYEPFSGSGTTIIACEQLGRKCYAIEIEPRYVDVAVRRWEKLTGKQATHAETGKTWREVADERGVAIADQ